MQKSQDFTALDQLTRIPPRYKVGTLFGSGPFWYPKYMVNTGQRIRNLNKRLITMKKLVLAATVVMAATGTTAVMADKGQEIYQQACFACHGTGAAGAPKLDDKANWAPRLAQGIATLEKHAIGGFQGKSGMMPPKGGRTDIADADIKAAVAYIASQAK